MLSREPRTDSFTGIKWARNGGSRVKSVLAGHVSRIFFYSSNICGVVLEEGLYDFNTSQPSCGFI